MTYRNWIDGIKAGRTVISRNGNKEFLDLKVANTASPGDKLTIGSTSALSPFPSPFPSPSNGPHPKKLTAGSNCITALSLPVGRVPSPPRRR